MDEPKFTRGPWRAVYNHHFWEVQCQSGGIADTCGTEVREGYERSEANAHLIAASPDLYEVCESLLEAVNKDGELSRLSEFSIIEIREAAIYALAKARGKQP